VTAGPILKYRPGDFVVRENLVVDLVDDGPADQHYLLLRKCGFTTMEAVRLLAGQLGISSGQITYGGLKDEDGVTEQLVSLPADALSIKDAEAGWRVTEGEDRWLQLYHYGYGREPLRVGELEGNGFRVVVRNIDPEIARGIADLRKINLLFLNYYDTQRFGVPGGPKLTHLVGRSILNEDWDGALRQLVALRAPESPLAQEWRGTAREFFTQLDPRTTGFYLAAMASFEWNARVTAAALTACPVTSYDVRLDGLHYRYPRSSDAAAAVMSLARELPCDKYTFRDGAPQVRRSTRTTVVQAAVHVRSTGPDRSMPDGAAVAFSFFLPSGSYATAMIRQLLGYLGEAAR
jgi:tRNA pseudouridine13 synthase